MVFQRGRAHPRNFRYGLLGTRRGLSANRLSVEAEHEKINPVHRGQSRFSRRKRYNAVKMLKRRENGTVPLAPRQGDRSMFSAYQLSAKYVFPPKNGPVPDWAVNAYKKSIPIPSISVVMAGYFPNNITCRPLSNGKMPENPLQRTIQRICLAATSEKR